MKKILLSLSLVLFVGIFAYGQSCNNFHRAFCPPAQDGNFKYNGQSKSGLVNMGESVEFNIVVYKKQDYRISFCVSPELAQGVKFKIFEERRERVEKEVKEIITQEDYIKCPDCEMYADGVIEMDGELYKMEVKEVEVVNTKSSFEMVKELLYNNEEDNMAQEIEFANEDTRRLTIEVTMEGEGASSGNKLKKLKVLDAGCVGVLVEHQPAARIGF
jgi:hypothetical protein